VNWKSLGHSWPNHQYSQFVKLDGMNWHVQTAGSGARILLLHGTGATTHSLADIFNILSQTNEVMALDLPGHGFTSRMYNGSPTLPSISAEIVKLLDKLSFQPDLIVGHSAGAAIAVTMTSHSPINPDKLVSINGAFYPFPGFAGQIFPMAARMLFVNPFVSHFFAFSASSRSRVEGLIDSTGSKLNERNLEYYQRALQSADHVEGTLAMMANWELEPVADQLKNLQLPFLQIIGDKDGTIEPSMSLKTQKLVEGSKREVFKGYGHLVHEETPQTVARSIKTFFDGKDMK
jgi:magnesium chelatase accessory protein